MALKKAKTAKGESAKKAPANSDAAAEAKAAPKAESKAKKARAAKADPTAVAVVNAENEKVRDITLAAEVFGVKVNQHLLYEAVKQYRAGGRLVPGRGE